MSGSARGNASSEYGWSRIVQQVVFINGGVIAIVAPGNPLGLLLIGIGVGATGVRLRALSQFPRDDTTSDASRASRAATTLEFVLLVALAIVAVLLGIRGH